MFLKHRVDVSFLFFAGFNCLDFYIRWVQHVVHLFCIFAVVMLPCLHAVQLQDVEVFDGFSYPSEFLCF